MIYIYRTLFTSIFFAFLLFINFSFAQSPELQENTGYVNKSLNYELMGYEERNKRFWLIVPQELVKNQEKINQIILSIYEQHKDKLNLNSLSWHISFFTDKSEAGYKTFEPDSYLAEYWSNNADDKKYKNKTYIYPANPKKTKWYHGPSKLAD